LPFTSCGFSRSVMHISYVFNKDNMIDVNTFVVENREDLCSSFKIFFSLTYLTYKNLSTIMSDDYAALCCSGSPKDHLSVFITFLSQ